MNVGSFGKTALLPLIIALPLAGAAQAQTANTTIPPSGIVKVKSAYSVQETVARIKKDVADKGIMWFSEVDQQQLAGNAGIKALHLQPLLEIADDGADRRGLLVLLEDTSRHGHREEAEQISVEEVVIEFLEC